MGIEMIVSGELPSNLAVSFGRAALGLGLGVTIGIVFGLILLTFSLIQMRFQRRSA